MLKIFFLFYLSFFINLNASQTDDFVVLLGTSGVGKSYLCNLLLKDGIEPFASLNTPAAVTKVFEARPAFKEGVMVADVPGITFDNFVSETYEIKKSLTKSKGRYKIGFVFTPVGGATGGRLNFSEFVTMEKILRAIPQNLPYFIVINRFSPAFNEKDWRELIKDLVATAPQNHRPGKQPADIFFIPAFDDHSDQKKYEWAQKFKAFVSKMPSGSLTDVSDISDIDQKELTDWWVRFKEEEERVSKLQAERKKELEKKAQSCCIPWFSKTKG